MTNLRSVLQAEGQQMMRILNIRSILELYQTGRKLWRSRNPCGEKEDIEPAFRAALENKHRPTIIEFVIDERILYIQ